MSLTSFRRRGRVAEPGAYIEPQRMQELFNGFIDSPMGREMLREESVRVHERRISLVGELEQLRQQRLARAAELDQALAREQTAVAKLEAQLADAKKRAETARSERWSVGLSIDNQIGAHERQLRDLAPDSIEAVIRDVRDAQEKIRRADTNMIKVVPRIIGNPVVGANRMIFSAYRNASQALVDLQGLVTEAEALKLTPLSDEELEVKVQELRARIPEISSIELEPVEAA